MKKLNGFWCPPAAFCLILAACSTSGPISEHSIRKIDQSFVLPPKVAAYNFEIGWGQFSQRNTLEKYTYTTLSPLMWRKGLTNRLTLKMDPLPLGLDYSFVNKPSSQMSGFFSVGLLGYSSLTGFRFSPQIGLRHKQKLGQNVALLSELMGLPSFNTKGRDFNFRSSLNSGLMFQIVDNFAVSSLLGIEMKSMPNGAETETLDSKIRANLPLELRFDWRVSPQWELNGRGKLSILGESKSEGGGLGTLGFSYYW